MDLPPSLPKNAVPFIQRANELSSHDAVIAYWCRMRAANMLLPVYSTDPAIGNVLVTLLDQLETAKKDLAGNQLISDEDAAKAYIENFAEKIFEKADSIDRAGKSNRTTAAEFKAAATFYDLLANFKEEFAPEVTEKIKYAKWKAVSIVKAIKEGRAPSPGPVNAQEEITPDVLLPPPQIQEPEEMVSAPELFDDLPTIPSAPSRSPTFSNKSPTFPSKSPVLSPVLPTYEPVLPPVASKPLPSQRPSSPQMPVENVDPSVIAKTQKHCKWAISALNYDDLETARRELRAALQLIGG